MVQPLPGSPLEKSVDYLALSCSLCRSPSTSGVFALHDDLHGVSIQGYFPPTLALGDWGRHSDGHHFLPYFRCLVEGSIAEGLSGNLARGFLGKRCKRFSNRLSV